MDRSLRSLQMLQTVSPIVNESFSGVSRNDSRSVVVGKVPTGMLYGSVVEHIDRSVEEMQRILVRLIGHPLRSYSTVCMEREDGSGGEEARQ